jgi:hypothetical protein
MHFSLILSLPQVLMDSLFSTWRPYPVLVAPPRHPLPLPYRPFLAQSPPCPRSTNFCLSPGGATKCSERLPARVRDNGFRNDTISKRSHWIWVLEVTVGPSQHLFVLSQIFLLSTQWRFVETNRTCTYQEKHFHSGQWQHQQCKEFGLNLEISWGQ